MNIHWVPLGRSQSQLLEDLCCLLSQAPHQRGYRPMLDERSGLPSPQGKEIAPLLFQSFLRVTACPLYFGIGLPISAPVFAPVASIRRYRSIPSSNRFASILLA